jgi:cellulose synthase/poly-beta-1,6-N-acetylglucosamine synthase-like glycosyltransferase
LIKKADFYRILDRDFASDNVLNATNFLTDIDPNSSAKNINYPKMAIGFLTVFFSGMILAINYFSIINNLLYFIQNLLKVILFSRSIAQDPSGEIEPEDMDDKLADFIKNHGDKLPIYSVLIPLYKEELKAGSILSAIEKLNYPKNKLDVKLIIEADDKMTIRALARLSIPSYIHIIKVPYSLPRTKPKALNYAMPSVLGKYLTIYDAEDEPDPNQLLKAVLAFSTLSENYICLQSKLNFYNAKENLLTRFFSIEYSIWFEYLLKGLSLFDLPLTLGGTSNHFKVDKLKEIGLWDAYNVTEDADLGIRLYLKGYKVSMIDSITMEEAPNNLKHWIGQRARWIKGFIKTIYVFMRVKKDYKKLGILKIFTVYIFVGISTYSFFFLPWLALLMYLDWSPVFCYLWLANSFFSLSYMYSIAYFVTSRKNSLVTFRSLLGITSLLCWPLYFTLHTIASYRALWETITSPFKWNKTPHGIGMSNSENIKPKK